MEAETLQSMALVRSLLTDRVIAFNPAIARITKDVKAALFFCQLMYWSDKGDDIRGWIYKTQADWTDETTLTRREQETARGKLRTLGLVTEARAGLPARLYFRVNWPQLVALLRPLARMHESAILESAKPPNITGGNRLTGTHESANHSTEITTYTTQENNEGPEWVKKLRTIEGWAERGAPHEDTLIAWADAKGFTPEYLLDHSIGVGSQQVQHLRKSANLAQKFQVACNKNYYGDRNGKAPATNGHHSDGTMDKIKQRMAKNAKE